MSDPVRWTGQMPPATAGGGAPSAGGGDGTNLADILERVLDKGIVIAGDIQINLLDIELLTIKLRLVVASVDRAKEMGIDWWERDPTLSSGHQELTAENDRLRARIEELESGRAGNGHAAGLEGKRRPPEPDDAELEEDTLEEDTLDEDTLDEDTLDEDPLDEVVEGEDALGEDLVDEDLLDEDKAAEDDEPDEPEPAPRRRRRSRS